MDTLLPAIAHAAFDRLKAVLDNLGAAPPQVLLLEGGSEAQRMDTARYWAMRINCPSGAVSGGGRRVPSGLGSIRPRRCQSQVFNGRARYR